MSLFVVFLCEMRYNGIYFGRGGRMQKRRTAMAIVLACAFMLCGCSGSMPSHTLVAKDEYGRFGTQARWVYVADEIADPDRIWERVCDRAEQIESDVSTEDAASSIARFNEADVGERVEIGQDAYEMLKIAQSVYEETGGAYNPATGLLVDLWGFSPRFHAANYAPEKPYDRENFMEELPDEKYVKKFSSEDTLDFGAVELGFDEELHEYYAIKPENACVEVDGETYTMQLNLGGIGKGYCADEVSAILREEGQIYGYYNVGGSSMSLFADPTREGEIWEITVNSPRSSFQTYYYATLHARDTMISTSGDYEQYYEIDGTRYCHIIDPQTGKPVGAGSHIVCASVVGGTAAEGDARATAICCMDMKEAVDYASKYADEFRVLFLYYDAEKDSYTAYSNLDEDDWEVDEPTVGREEIK